jgi:hypothetical protein
LRFEQLGLQSLYLFLLSHDIALVLRDDSVEISKAFNHILWCGVLGIDVSVLTFVIVLIMVIIVGVVFGVCIVMIKEK